MKFTFENLPAFRGAARAFSSRSEVRRSHFRRVQKKCDAVIFVAFSGVTGLFSSRSEVRRGNFRGVKTGIFLAIVIRAIFKRQIFFL